MKMSLIGYLIFKFFKCKKFGNLRSFDNYYTATAFGWKKLPLPAELKVFGMTKIIDILEYHKKN